MIEQYVDRVHSEHAVLDIGQDIGALVIYTREELLGQEIEVSPKGKDAQRIHSAVLERRANGRTMFAALFLALSILHGLAQTPVATTPVGSERGTTTGRCQRTAPRRPSPAPICSPPNNEFISFRTAAFILISGSQGRLNSSPRSFLVAFNIFKPLRLTVP